MPGSFWVRSCCSTSQKLKYLVSFFCHPIWNLCFLDFSFCFVAVVKSLTARCNTSYKPKTLNPTWNEDFVLDVNKVEEVVIIKKSVNLVMSLVFFLLKIIFRRYFKIVCLKDCLRVDIWDFNDEESVNDKFGKINQVGWKTLCFYNTFDNVFF